jgi:hypothetical protein
MIEGKAAVSAVCANRLEEFRMVLIRGCNILVLETLNPFGREWTVLRTA